MSWVQENWPILAGFAGGLVAWGKNTADVASAKRSVSKAHERVNDVEKDITAVKESIARIETHLEYTRSGIDDIRDRLS